MNDESGKGGFVIITSSFIVLIHHFLMQWTAGELNPDSLGANQVSYQIGPAARK